MPGPDGLPTLQEILEAQRIQQGGLPGPVSLPEQPARFSPYPSLGQIAPIEGLPRTNLATALGSSGPPIKAAGLPPSHGIPNQSAVVLNQAIAAKAAQSKVAQAEPIEPITDMSDEVMEASRGENAATNLALPDRSRYPTGIIGQSVIGPGQSFLGVQGEAGEDVFDEVMVKSSERKKALTEELGQLEEDKGAKTAEALRVQSEEQKFNAGVARTHYNSNLAQVEQAQAKYDKAMDGYTQDLADRGQFWHNPGNIIAAIGALIVGFAKRDPEVGQRIINQAIEGDWNKRRQLADMHLGELRSNVSNYRQAMQDKNAGDQMALVQSHIQAGLTMQRLSAQMQGPIAKKQLELEAENQFQIGGMKRIALWNQVVYQKAQLAHPLVSAAEKATSKVKGGYRAYGQVPTPTGQPQAPSQGQPQSYAGSDTVEGSSYSAPVPAKTGSVGGKYVPTAADKAIHRLTGNKSKRQVAQEAMVESRVPGIKESISELKEQIEFEVNRKLGPRATRQQLEAADLDKVNEGKEQVRKMTTTALAMKDNHRKWGQVVGDVRALKSAVATMNKKNGTNMTADDFIGKSRNIIGPAWTSYINNMRSVFADESTPEARQSMAELRAAERFRQALASNILDVYHIKLGAAMSEDELKLAKPVINAEMGIDGIENFADNQAREAGAFERQKFEALGAAGKLFYLVEQGKNVPRVNSPGATPKGR